MGILSIKCGCISDPLMEVDFDEVEHFDLEDWKNCLKVEKKVSDGLNSIKFLKFDQILQQQLYNISFPMIRFRFFGASKTTRKLSKPPKIMTMDSFHFRLPLYKRENESLDVKDFVFFVRYGMTIEHSDLFKSKLFYAINTCVLRTIFINLPTMNQILKALDLIPNLPNLIIGLQDGNLVVNGNDFEILTKKIGNITKLKYIRFENFNIPNNWEKICKENFKNLPNFRQLSIDRPVLNISINVIDLHDLMTGNNISVRIDSIQDDSFVELPEFKDRFKLQEQCLNGKRLYISKGDKSSYYQPL